MSKSEITPADTELLHKVLKKFKPNTEIAIAKVHNNSVSFKGVKLGTSGQIEERDNHNSVFEIGSISKTFTCLLLAQLVEQNKIDLDDSITPYLGYPIRGENTISFRQLATHTSGLSRLPPSMFWTAFFGKTTNPFKDYDADQLKDDLTNRIRLKKQGKCRYSNLGMGMLGHILGLTGKASYEELLEERIFRPLDMTHSAGNYESLTSELVPGLNKKGLPCSQWDFKTLAGAGSILSTTSDLVKYVQAQFDPANSAAKLTQQTHHIANKAGHIGLGWMIRLPHMPEGNVWHWHNGGTGGYSSALVMDCKNKTASIVLSNVSALMFFKSQAITALAFDLQDKMETS